MGGGEITRIMDRTFIPLDSCVEEFFLVNSKETIELLFALNPSTFSKENRRRTNNDITGFKMQKNVVVGERMSSDCCLVQKGGGTKSIIRKPGSSSSRVILLDGY